MTSLSKSCQIELFDHVAAGSSMMREDLSSLGLTPEYLPCADRPKNMLIIKSLDISNTVRIKLRLCDFHFELLYKDFERYTKGRPETSLRCKFKRNRLW